MKKIILKLFPGIKWLRGYTLQTGIADAIAGLTVGLTVLPQGLAYATLAGLEPQYGLYSAFMGGIVYAILGGCKQVTIGPTALLALITSKHTGLGGNSGPVYAVLLCFLSGIVELVMAFLKLGALVDLISLPVTVGFTSATAVIIGTSQLKGLLGIKSGSGSNFLETIKSVFSNLDKIRIGDVTLGIVSICVLLLLRKLKDLNVRENGENGCKTLKAFIWILSTSRNALLVLFTSVLSFYLCKSGECPFILTGTVKSGLPSFSIPKFAVEINGQNGTVIEQNFVDMVTELGSSVIILPIIAVLGNVAIAKAFSGAGINATRELIALSLSNICGSLFSSIPVTGSFSRSAVNHASGVRTPIGGIYTSIVVLLALGLLTPYFQYIPKAALSAVIISAVIFMIEYEVVTPLWRCNKRELLPGAITFVISLWLGVEIGLLLGVLTDLAFLIYRAARPALSVSKFKTNNDIEYILVRPKHSLLYFPAIEWVRTGIAKAVKSFGVIPIILDCTHLNEFDFTAARGMGALHKELTIIGVPFFLLRASNEVKVIIKEATNNSIRILDTVEDLETFSELGTGENQNAVVVPLLNNDNEIDIDKSK